VLIANSFIIYHDEFFNGIVNLAKTFSFLRVVLEVYLSTGFGDESQ
jgi:hypothetical protein